MLVAIEEKNNLSVTDDFKEFICDFLTEATAGMLVNGFKDKKTVEHNRTCFNGGISKEKTGHYNRTEER